MDIDFLYHYTSIQTLELILKYKTIRFNNLTFVDDIEEAESKDMGSFGKFVYVSCWTSGESESIPLWNMYTTSTSGISMSGVRIKLKKMPFKKYHFHKGEFFLKSDVDTYINLEEVSKENKLSITPDQPQLIKVEYTDDESKIYPTIKTESYCGAVEDYLAANSLKEAPPSKISYSLRDIGKYKRTDWSFQREWRYIIKTSPMGIYEMNPPTFQKQKELIRKLESRNSEPPCEQIFLQIDDAAFRTMEITLGPRIQSSDRDIVDRMVKMYNPCCKIYDSTLRIR